MGAVSDFYSRYAKQSWKNVITIGDDIVEHHAMHRVVSIRPVYREGEKCLMKNIKFVGRPSQDMVACQLTFLRSWLERIVKASSDVIIDFSCAQKHLDEWMNTFGPCESSPLPSPKPAPVDTDVIVW